MKYLSPLLLTLSLTFAQAQAQTATTPTSAASIGLTTTTDTKAVLELLKGNVDMYGTSFGTAEFQRGILQLAQQKAITVRLMTNPSVVQNFKPLRAVGASIYGVPASFTNSMIAVQGGPLIFPGKTSYQIITDQRQAAAVMALMTQYWQIAKAY